MMFCMEPGRAPSLPLAANDGEIIKIAVRAEYFEGQIDLKRFRAEHSRRPTLLSDPIVIEPEPGAFAAITKFGAIVFWNCGEAASRALMEEIARMPGALHINDSVRDKLDVYIGHAQPSVTFNDVRLKDLTIEKIKIISLALGQSVALERFELEMHEAMRRIETVVAVLRDRGELTVSGKEALKVIGFALHVRAAILANLTLFDDPPELWESEALSFLDRQLYDLFDLGERLSALNQKASYLTEVNSIITDLLNQRKNQRLEWIVIILIFIEIVFFIGYELAAK